MPSDSRGYRRRRYDSPSGVASLAYLFFLFFASTPHTAAQNCTVDDNDFQDQASLIQVNNPGVTYSPPGAWLQGSECKNCSTTKLDDISQVFNGTWHEALHTPGDLEPRVIRVMFYGSAVFIYFIVPGNVVTNTTFRLDGEPAGEFVREPTGSPGFRYNVPGFVNTTLSMGYHRLEIIATGEVNPSRILFDYAVYTPYDPFGILPTGVNSPDSFYTSTLYIPNIPAIIGSAVGSVIIVAGAIAFFCYCRRRRRRRLDRTRANKTWFLPASNRIEILADESMKDDQFGPMITLENTSVSVNEVQSDIATIGTLRQSLPPPPPLPPPPHPLPRDPSGIKRTVSSPESRATARCKPDLRRQELQERTELAQGTIETLRRQASVSTGEVPHNDGDIDHLGVGSQTHEIEILRHRIVELQVEVDQLRAKQGSLDAKDVPPPVYDDRRTVPVRRGAS